MGLLDSVPSDTMTFERQIELALIQSRRDAIRKERRDRALRAARGEMPRAIKGRLESGSPERVMAPSYPMPTESSVGEFVIQEATEKVELGGFEIVASDRQL